MDVSEVQDAATALKKAIISVYPNDKFHELLNNILKNYIPKSKLKSFSDLITVYGFRPSSFTYITEEREIRGIQKLSAEEIRKRLFMKIKKVNKVEFDYVSSSDKDAILKRCDDIVNKIKYNEKKGKIYYYYLGQYLGLIKIHFTIEDTVENYNIFIEQRYNIKLSTLTKYIKFNVLCDKYSELLECDLSFSEIMNNVPEIEGVYQSLLKERFDYLFNKSN